ncbi:MAG: Asp-tRNA(Asn)/Glu-tRNA(Gln) amidotransferase subunit GatC [Anaerolineae bacterium]
MAITRDEVEHIADLAHLALSEEEKTRYQEQLSAILEYAAELQALDTEDIPPTATVLPLRTVLREDIPGETLAPEVALSNGPEVEVGCFFVPPVVVKE